MSKEDWNIEKWKDVNRPCSENKRMTDEEVVDKVFTTLTEDMIFKCETIADVERVDAHITELKDKGHPMDEIRYLWNQLFMVAEGIERSNFDKYGHTDDPNQNKDE